MCFIFRDITCNGIHISPFCNNRDKSLKTTFYVSVKCKKLQTGFNNIRLSSLSANEMMIDFAKNE